MPQNERGIHSGPDKAQVARLFSATSTDHPGQALFTHHGQILVDWTGVGPGDEVLDVAAGTGASLLPAARRVGPKGRVVGVDIAAGMVRQLSNAIAAQRLANANAMLGDAEQLPFHEHSFDVVICAFGLFFFPHVDRALLEFRRVLRPAGRLAIATFTKSGSNSIDRTWALIGRYTEVPPQAETPMRFDDFGRVREVLEHARFVDVEIREEPYVVVLPNANAWWQWIRAMEFREHVDRLPATVQQELRAAALREFGQGPIEDRISFSMNALFARARSSTVSVAPAVVSTRDAP